MLLFVLRWILATILFALVLFIPVSIGAFLFYKSRRDPGWGERPETFPIAVMSKGRLNVVYKRDLQKFIASSPDYTFLIPKTASTPRLELLDRAGGSQAIHLNASKDDDIDNESWYLARAKSIEPQYHRYTLDLGLAIATVFTTAAIVAVAAPILALAVVAWRTFRRSATLAAP